MDSLPAGIIETIARESGLPGSKVEGTVKLLDAGNTVPFIARYRKEFTGELDEVQIRRVEELVSYYRNLEQRRAEVLRIIEEQGKLTDEIRQRLMAATKQAEVEDIYRPFRQKRRTRAGQAREKGLEPLAEYIRSFPVSGNPEHEAALYLSNDVPSVEEALQGAMDIVAEQVADDPDVRGWVRSYARKKGWLVSRAKDTGSDSVYRMYYDYREPVPNVAPHRVLAINRGEREDVLTVSIELDQEEILAWLQRRFVKQNSVTSGLAARAAADAYRRLVAPAVERDVRNELTEKAEEQALKVFARNLRSLLLQPPVPGKVVLGVDPAYRTGCKWAVVDETGKLLETGVVYPTPPQKKVKEAKAEFDRLVDKYGVQVIAIGNGTASRETEQFVAGFIKERQGETLAYVIVSEAGASVYSASELAAGEFPQLDVTARSAVSIARRLQDPLAELVKIEPRAIGVGQYQHDVAPKKLDENLAKVVESVVNYVGVDLNTASAALLKYVAGINAVVAENIVKYRELEGKFVSRRQLAKVPRLGPKTMEQCAGFLRVRGGENPLDATSIHPESYKLVGKLLELIDTGPEMIGSPSLRAKLARLDVEQIAAELNAGVPTLKDVRDALARPGRDPREELPPPLFRIDVLKVDDLKQGMVLKGVVRNVVDFGAFVDIGVKNDGLVHISELSREYVRHPLDVVSVGDTVTVKVLSVETGSGRIALSMKL
ncbi:Tex family protein [Desulfotruncus alcoholivorax]|uniref:Tex family protein n=1 Tax=Desulfotruncus alcoholivorax TaxID=265477 RepID=UPI000400E126|nr:Tex family protein [Desulfotruncus alcoholivorax]